MSQIFQLPFGSTNHLYYSIFQTHQKQLVRFFLSYQKQEVQNITTLEPPWFCVMKIKPTHTTNPQINYTLKQEVVHVTVKEILQIIWLVFSCCAWHSGEKEK